MSIAIRDTQACIEKKGGKGITVIKKSKNKGKITPYFLILPFLFLYIVFVIIPTVGIAFKSFTLNNDMKIEILDLPSLVTTEFTFQNYTKLFTNSYNQRLIVSTISISVLSVLITVLLGTPISYLVTRSNFRYRHIVRWLISLPVYLPVIVVAYALLQFFGPYGVFNEVMESIFGIRLVLAFTYPAVIAGTVIILLPMYVRTVSSSFESISPELVESSLSLGGTEFYTLRRVILPISLPSILAAVILIFSFSIGFIEMALVLGGGLNVLYLPVEILNQSRTVEPNIPYVSALATVLLAISFTGQLLATTLLGRRNLI